MGPCLGGDFHPAKHTGDFLETRGIVQRGDACRRPAAVHLFNNLEMGIAEARDLGQVRDTDDLMMAGLGL